MSNKLHVGGLSYDVNDQGLAEIFSSVGKVESAKVIIDRDTGRSKGFGFVEMSSADEAQKAINSVNGSTHSGRTLTVSIAKPMEKRTGGGGGGRSGGGGNRDRWDDRGGRGGR